MQCYNRLAARAAPAAPSTPALSWAEEAVSCCSAWVRGNVTALNMTAAGTTCTAHAPRLCPAHCKLQPPSIVHKRSRTSFQVAMAFAALRRVGDSFLPRPAGRRRIAAVLIAGAAAVLAPTVSRKALEPRISPTRCAISRFSLLRAGRSCLVAGLCRAPAAEDPCRGTQTLPAARRRPAAAPLPMRSPAKPPSRHAMPSL